MILPVDKVNANRTQQIFADYWSNQNRTQHNYLDYDIDLTVEDYRKRKCTRKPFSTSYRAWRVHRSECRARHLADSQTNRISMAAFGLERLPLFAKKNAEWTDPDTGEKVLL